MVDEAHGGSAVVEQGGRLCHPQTFWHRDQAVYRDDGPLQVTAALGGISDNPAAHPVRIHACPHGAHLSGHTAARHVPVQAAAGPVISHRGPRVRMGGSFLHVPQRDPASKLAVMNACRSVCGVTGLVIPARRAVLRTIRPAPCRSTSNRRRQEYRPVGALAGGQVDRRAVRGASGMVTTLPPLRVMVRVRWPRSRPSCSMSAPAASDTRRPFRASSEISACSGGGPSPAATSSAPSSGRSRATAWDS